MRDVAILSAVRTPIGRAVKGNLRQTRPDDLGALVVKEALRRADLPGRAAEDVVLGCAHPEGEQGLNVARLISLLAGLPDEVPAMTINRFCSSGLQATAIIADRIAVGAIDAGISGGVESMSLIPMGGVKPSFNPRLVDTTPDAYIPRRWPPGPRGGWPRRSCRLRPGSTRTARGGRWWSTATRGHVPTPPSRSWPP